MYDEYSKKAVFINIKNTSSVKWNKWIVIQKQCIMGCFWTEIKTTNDRLTFKKKGLQNEKQNDTQLIHL